MASEVVLGRPVARLLLANAVLACGALGFFAYLMSTLSPAAVLAQFAYGLFAGLTVCVLLIRYGHGATLTVGDSGVRSGRWLQAIPWSAVRAVDLVELDVPLRFLFRPQGYWCLALRVDPTAAVLPPSHRMLDYRARVRLGPSATPLVVVPVSSLSGGVAAVRRALASHAPAPLTIGDHPIG